MINIIMESSFSTSYWCSQYMRGINHEAKRKNLDIQTANDISKLGKADEGSVAILIGTSLGWLNHTVNALRRINIHAVVLSACRQQNLGGGVSYVTMDYEDAFKELTAYLSSLGRRRLALFAPDPDSATDQNKRAAFLNSGENRSESDVYYFNATLDDACRSLYDNIDKYDSVICANHISQVVLTKFLTEQKIRIPTDIHLAYFGDLWGGKISHDDHTLLRIKAEEAGRLAIRCVRLLKSYPDLSSVSLNVHCDIVTSKGIFRCDAQSDDTADKPIKVDTVASHKHISNALMLEKILCNCDRVDIEILEGIIKKESYSKIALRVHISENTIGYRIKRLMQFAETQSKDEMINALRPYLN